MSRVIKAIIAIAVLVGVSQVSVAAERPDNNLAALEQIRSETALADAQIVLLEKKQKLEDLQSGKSSKEKPTDLQPMPVPISFRNNAPAMGMLPGAEGLNPVKQESEKHDEVLGVVGVDGKYTATVRTETGIYTVSQGDKIPGGVVAAISLDKVVLKKADKSMFFLLWIKNHEYQIRISWPRQSKQEK